MALTLLHHLAYPSPYAKPLLSSTQAESASVIRDRLLSATDTEIVGELPQGVNIGERLNAADKASPVSAGIHHIFQATLGVMSFAEIDNDDEVIRIIQCECGLDCADVGLSQDLLEAVAEGPEADSVYELYAGVDAEADPEPFEEMDDVQLVE
jgi:hypothetical protein